MDISSHVNDELVQLFIITAVTIGAILPSIYSLTHGIFEVFPFLYILSIILVVYFYPRYGVPYSLGISLVYIGLVYFFGSPNPVQIAISTIWFVIFVVMGIVASTYANRLRDKEKTIRKVFENAQDGIFCFELRSMHIHEINPMCARMLRYTREDLVGKELSTIWINETERDQFLSCVEGGEKPCQKEVVLRAKDGAPHRCLISAILTTNHVVYCSAIDITKQKIPDDEIRQTLEDLERQVKERTAHLEKINEELKADLLEHQKFEATILSSHYDVNHSAEGRK
jgi:PAS domain S-box-containing protein